MRRSAAIASVVGTGGFESLSFNPAAVSTTVSDVVDVTTVNLTAAVAGGGTIVYTASVGANPVLSDVAVSLDNGQIITIAAGQTSGAVTVSALSPGVHSAAIASVTGTGGFESLAFNQTAVTTTFTVVTLDETNAPLSTGGTLVAAAWSRCGDVRGADRDPGHQRQLQRR